MMSIHKMSTNRPKSMANHKPLEDWNDDDSDSNDGKIFFVSSVDEVGEEEVFGNDYFERNGIPVPEEETDEDNDTRDATDDGLDATDEELDATDEELDATDEGDDLDWGEYRNRFEDEDIILDGSIDETNQDDSIGQEGEGEEGNSTSDEDAEKDENEDERKKSKNPVKPSINPFIGNNQKQRREWKHIQLIPFMEKCDLCSKTFSSKYLYMLHDPCYNRRLALKRREDKSTNIGDKSVEINSGLNQDFPYECLECDRKFETRTIIGNHARSHYTPDFKCELCPFVTCWHSTASRHEKSHLRNRVRWNRKESDSKEADLFRNRVRWNAKESDSKEADLFRNRVRWNAKESDSKEADLFRNRVRWNRKESDSKEADLFRNRVRWNKKESDSNETGLRHDLRHDLKYAQVSPFEKDSNLSFKTFETKLTYSNHSSCPGKRSEEKWDQSKFKNKSTGMKDKSTEINHGLIRGKYKCTECHQGYNYSNGLKHHQFSHFNPQLECRICSFINCYPVGGLRHGKIHFRNDDREEEEWDDREEEEEEWDDREEEEEWDGGNDEENDPDEEEEEEEEENESLDLIQKYLESNEELKFTELIPFHKTCDHCGKEFQSKGRYITHSPCYIQKLAAKKIKINSEKNNSTENNSSRIEYLDENFLYECTVCDKSFSRMPYLAQHAQIHFGPSFKCKLCPHTSQFKQCATLHEQRHLSKYQVTVPKRHLSKYQVTVPKRHLSKYQVTVPKRHLSKYQVTVPERHLSKYQVTVSRKRKGEKIKEKSSKRIKSDLNEDELSNDPFFSAGEDEEEEKQLFLLN